MADTGIVTVSAVFGCARGVGEYLRPCEGDAAADLHSCGELAGGCLNYLLCLDEIGDAAGSICATPPVARAGAANGAARDECDRYRVLLDACRQGGLLDLFAEAEDARHDKPVRFCLCKRELPSEKGLEHRRSTHGSAVRPGAPWEPLRSAA